jgi:hypothetical protein
MPIKPENRARYPKDWPAISLAAKERAGWKCQHQGCSARQYAVGCWEGSFFFEIDQPPTYAEARQRAADESFTRHGDGPAPADEKIIVIVLTVAHLNHEPEDCRPENLAAMCQRHHLAYDHDHHRANAQATRRAKSGTLEMF